MKNDLTKLDIRAAVLFSVEKFKAGDEAFFAETEYGRIAIEMDGFKDPNPFHSVVVLPWVESPRTLFTINNRTQDADWYVSIPFCETTSYMKLCLINAFSTVMIASISEEISDEMIDAAVYFYFLNYQKKRLTVNFIQKEFIDNNFNRIEKRMQAVELLTREVIESRVTYATELVKKSQRFMDQLEKQWELEGSFHDTYSRDIFGLVSYKMREELQAERKSQPKQLMEVSK